MTTYYLATDGDDAGTGTKRDPFETFEPIAADGPVDLEPDDTVLVMGGVIEVGRVDLGHLRGADGRPIQIRPYGSDNAVIEVTGTRERGVELGHSSWVELHDLEIRGAAEHCVFVWGSTTSNVLLSGLEVHDPGRRWTGAAIAIEGEVGPVTVRDCHLHGNAKGLVLDGGPADCRVVGCTFEHNAECGIDLGALAAERPNVVRRCTARRNGFDGEGRRTGTGHGFSVGRASARTGGHVLEQCVAYYNRGDGFVVGGVDAPVEVRNCTAWANLGAGFGLDDGGPEPRNCLAWGNRAGAVGPSADAGGQNSWSLGIDDPGFASTDETSTDFLSLSATSPAVGAGVTAAGEPCDLGAKPAVDRSHSGDG